MTNSSQDTKFFCILAMAIGYKRVCIALKITLLSAENKIVTSTECLQFCWIGLI